jgi:hypothetical protein
MSAYLQGCTAIVGEMASVNNNIVYFKEKLALLLEASLLILNKELVVLIWTLLFSGGVERTG